MSWAKLDDRFHENRKIKRVWRRCPAAVGLHVMAITYCAGHETDGLVDVEFVDEKVPKKRERDRAVTELVAAGLWHESKDPKDGWEINDFLVFNPSREEAAETRKSKREAGRKGAAARWGDAGDKASAMAPVIAGVIAGANGTAMADDAPTRPDPNPTAENPSVGKLCDLLADLIEGNGSKRPTISERWRTEARLLLERDGRSVKEAEAVIRWCQASSFWKTNILSMPKLREKFDQLRLKMDERPGRPSNHVGAGPSGLEGEIRQWERWCAENGVSHPHGPQVAWRLSRHGDKVVTVEKVTAMLPSLTAAEEANAA